MQSTSLNKLKKFALKSMIIFNDVSRVPAMILIFLLGLYHLRYGGWKGFQGIKAFFLIFINLSKISFKGKKEWVARFSCSIMSFHMTVYRFEFD